MPSTAEQCKANTKGKTMINIAFAAAVFINPYTGQPLPPEPQHDGCFCSVHYKSIPDPREPAKPFRQGVEAPPIESIPDPLAPLAEGITGEK